MKKNNHPWMKASDEQIVEQFNILKSCRKVAEVFNMSPKTVWYRLKKLGLNTPVNILSEEDKCLIVNLYNEGFKRGDGKLNELSTVINRTVPSISRFAKSQELTNNKRSPTEESKDKNSGRMKKWLVDNEHPRGMLGKKHTPEVCKDMAVRHKNWYADSTPEMKFARARKMVTTQRNNGVYNRKHGSWKSEWRTIGGVSKYYRSRWEANYARYLERCKQLGEIQSWEHEPQTFWFGNILRGVRSYLPDFKIINNDGSHHWVEVKGWMDPKSATKIKRFKKYYPKEVMVLIRVEWFNANEKNLISLIDDWEVGEK